MWAECIDSCLISFNFENVSPLQVLLIQIHVYDVDSVENGFMEWFIMQNLASGTAVKPVESAVSFWKEIKLSYEDKSYKMIVANKSKLEC